MELATAPTMSAWVDSQLWRCARSFRLPCHRSHSERRRFLRTRAGRTADRSTPRGREPSTSTATAQSGGASRAAPSRSQDKSHNGHQDWSLTGCDKRFKDESDKTITVCQANNTIYFSASTVWWLSLSGSGVSASVVASGGFYIKGSGGYHLNGGGRKTWPSGGKFLQL